MAGRSPKRHFKTRYTGVFTANSIIYQSYPSTPILQAEGSISTFTTRNGVLRSFNLGLKRRSQSTHLGLDREANTEHGIFWMILSSLISVLNPSFGTSTFKASSIHTTDSGYAFTLTYSLDIELQNHIFQIVVEPCERTAEVYTHDSQLKATFTLGEGGQGLAVSEHSFGISTEGSSSRKENSRNSEKTCTRTEYWENESVHSDVAALLRGDKEVLRQVLQMPEKQREIVLQHLNNQ